MAENNLYVNGFFDCTPRCGGVAAAREHASVVEGGAEQEVQGPVYCRALLTKASSSVGFFFVKSPVLLGSIVGRALPCAGPYTCTPSPVACFPAW